MVGVNNFFLDRLLLRQTTKQWRNTYIYIYIHAHIAQGEHTVVKDWPSYFFFIDGLQGDGQIETKYVCKERLVFWRRRWLDPEKDLFAE